MKNFFKILMQYCVPQHLLSRVMGVVSNLQRPSPLKNLAIRLFIRRYQVNMQEALMPDPESYPTFNAFFTRALIPGLRSVDQQPESIVSPADGMISAFGKIHQDRLIQAKNHTFALDELLGGQKDIAQLFQNGQFVTIYLAPRDYHRVHMPVIGNLQKMIYVPGKLFSVNGLTAEGVPNLFARNERVITLFETQVGYVSVILVGAMIVGSIATQWAGVVAPSKGRQIQHWNYDDLLLNKGDELGRFQLGSTVIVLFQENRIEWSQNDLMGQSIKMGEMLAKKMRVTSDAI